MDYHSDSIAQSLKQRRTNLIGVIVPEIKHNIFSAAISWIEEIACGNGYAIIVSQSNKGYSRERVNVRALISNRVAGLLISIFQTIKRSDNFKVPKDIALVDCSNNPITRLIKPSLTTVIQPAYKVGKRVAKLLIEQIKSGKNFIPGKEISKAKLIIRGSA